MEKRNSEFAQIDLLKERYRHRIQEQETRIKSSFSDLSDNLTGVALFNKVKDNLFNGSGFAFKLGFMAVTMLRKRLNDRSKK
ncbi:MAG: hypothetical protein HGA23_02825 [Bacteroidales bacterium]|nr:hypothetical protein [Bacteroidales bacterium]